MANSRTPAELKNCKLENPSSLFRPLAQYLGSENDGFWAPPSHFRWIELFCRASFWPAEPEEVIINVAPSRKDLETPLFTDRYAWIVQRFSYWTSNFINFNVYTSETYIWHSTCFLGVWFKMHSLDGQVLPCPFVGWPCTSLNHSKNRLLGKYV